MHTRLAVLALTAMILPAIAAGDSTPARCDIYPAGSDLASKMLACVFSQTQGHVVIARDDGVTHDLAPADGFAPGTFLDADGRLVYRQGDLGDQGQIYRMRDETIYVYWSTSALDTAQDRNRPTWPFTTDEFDATTVLRCRASGEKDFGSCPAGILRMEDRQASIVIQSPIGERFTVNFMTDYVNATNRSVEAMLDGDTWTVIVDDGDVYEVPRAAIEGG